MQTLSATSRNGNGRTGAEFVDMNDDVAEVLHDEKAISARVAELGRQISRDYAGRRLVLIGVMKGGIVFLSDLTRAISIPHEFDLVGAQSYRNGTTPAPQVTITKDIDLDIKGCDVLLIEDIYDTGHTLKVIHDLIELSRPASLEVCAFLVKKKERPYDLKPKYSGFEIDDVFVVGYGLDYKEKYRNLKSIAKLDPEVYQ